MIIARSDFAPTLRSVSGERHPCLDVAESPQQLDDLRLAHTASDNLPYGDPISHETLEGLRMAAIHSLTRWPMDQRVDFLSDLSASEVAIIFERIDTNMREELLMCLPAGLRQDFDALWGGMRHSGAAG